MLQYEPKSPEFEAAAAAVGKQGAGRCMSDHDGTAAAPKSEVSAARLWP